MEGWYRLEPSVYIDIQKSFQTKVETDDLAGFGSVSFKNLNFIAMYIENHMDILGLGKRVSLIPTKYPSK